MFDYPDVVTGEVKCGQIAQIRRRPTSAAVARMKYSRQYDYGPSSPCDSCQPERPMEVVQVERLWQRLDSWFPSSSRTPDARVMLFCLPYAGGAASVFRGWADGLPDDVECVAVHLPDREARVAESPAIDVVQLSRAIGRRAVGRPYALVRA
jgi:hypothetical protein